MIAPHELKNKVLSKAVRGYNCSEVDEYIEFIIDKYTELYRENAENEKELRILNLKYDELRNDEETIRAVIVKAQKLGESIVSQAKNEAEKIVESAREKCESAVREASERIEEEKEMLGGLQKVSELFRDKLYRQYLEHIEAIKDLDFSIPEPSDGARQPAAELEEDVLRETEQAIRKAQDGIGQVQGKILTGSEEAMEESGMPLRKKVTVVNDTSAAELFE